MQKYQNKLNILEDIRKIYNKELNYSNTSNHLYRVEIENRDNFISYMKDNGVSCGIHYEALHTHPVYKINDDNLPLTESKSKTTVSIPFNELLTNTNVSTIIDLIKRFK